MKLERIKTRRTLMMFAVAIAVTLLTFLLIAVKVRFGLGGRWEGLFLLRDAETNGLRVANKLFLGEEGKVVGGWSLPSDDDSSPVVTSPGEPFLELEWDVEGGYGVVRNHLRNGHLLQTHFSRYLDSGNRYTHGLFVGGAITSALAEGDPLQQNDSGMAYFDGKNWQHIWCNTNEGIGSIVNYRNSFAPSQWDYRGSRVLENSSNHLVLSSLHEVRIDEVPMGIERTVDFSAGEAYFNLAIRITNAGSRAVHYYYYYGDEPWVGDFGSSAGDVGWTAEGLVRFEERIDPRRQSFAGMVDHGNEAIGEGHRFGHVANFIEWFGPNRPDIVFFANRYDGFNHPAEILVPLQGNARSIGMYWGPRTIRPGETQSMLLAIGMAEWPEGRNSPVSPIVNTRHHLGHLLTHSGNHQWAK